MTKVFIIRHAEVKYPLNEQGERLMYPPETHISEEGKRQTAILIEMLQENGVKLDLIETSQYTRAQETAEILAAGLGNPPILVNPAFNDSFIPGWIDIPLNEQQKLMEGGEDIYDHPHSHDQETREKIAQRMLAGFHDLVERNKGKTVAIVSHGDPLRFLKWKLDNPEGEIPNMSQLREFDYLKRSEAFSFVLDEKGKIFKTELLQVHEGKPGEREKY